MSNAKRIGVEVDEDLWREFREDVKQRHGRVSGVLAAELESAIRQYLYTGEHRDEAEILRQIEDRVKRIENSVQPTTGDGGTDTFEPDGHTHAPEPSVDGKPPANAATEKKVAYLAACVREDYGETFGSIKRSELIEIVKMEYGFRSDTARRYVDQLIEHFDLREHIKTNEILVTQEEYEKMVEFEKEEARREAEETLDAI